LKAEAYAQLGKDDPELIQFYESEASRCLNASKLDADPNIRREQMNRIIELKQKEIESKAWKAHF
jgi:hypothetical protein